jgi:hypothetical protein
MKNRVPQLFTALAAFSLGALACWAEKAPVDAAAPLPFTPPASPAPAAAAPVTPVAPVSAPVLATAATNGAKGAHIVFETPVYEFGRAKSGDPIKHTFIFTNTGDQVLEIKNVRPGCGCTTAGEWTKTVEPNKTGSIPIQVNTANFNGPVTKPVNVDTSDPTQATVLLQIKGTLWKPIDVQPALAYFTASADSPAVASSVVHIKSNLDKPLSLAVPEISNKLFTAEVKAVEEGKDYQVVVGLTKDATNVGPQQATITFKTTSEEVPTVSFTAYANVQAAVSVSPPAIALPMGPLANKVTPVLTIQNNGTNTLKVSDAEVSLPDVVAQVSESIPNKTFNVTLTFPEGFEIPAGQKAEFTVKTSHPQFPTIKVPINQPVRPASAVVPVKNATGAVVTNRPNLARMQQRLAPPPAPAKPTATQ